MCVYVCVCARSDKVPNILNTPREPMEGNETWFEAYVRGEREAKRKTIAKDELCERPWMFCFRVDHFRMLGIICARIIIIIIIIISFFFFPLPQHHHDEEEERCRSDSLLALFLASYFPTAPVGSQMADRIPAWRCIFSQDGRFQSTVEGAISQKRRLKWRFLRANCISDILETSLNTGNDSGDDTVDKLKCGSLIQVGSYPPLKVQRRSDWGWLMVNDYVLIQSVSEEEEQAERTTNNGIDLDR